MDGSYRSDSRCASFSPAVLACLLAVVPCSVVLAQATLDPNQIVGDVELTNTNPDVLAILNAPSATPPGADKGFWSGSLRADSIGITPTFNNSTGVAVASRTTASYEVTVESSSAGIPYRLHRVDMFLDRRGDLYRFAEQNSLPVFPEPAPDVVLDFAECAGIVDVHFVDEDGVPVSVDGGSIIARRQPSNVVQAQDSSLPAGTSTETLAIRGDGTDYRINVNYFTTFGSDPFTDLIRFSGQCQELITMACDEIRVVECVIPVEDGEGPGDDDLGDIIGVVDMLGEEEHRIPSGLTRMTAFSGPFNNSRLDFVDNTPPNPPSSGAFLLPNLLRSDFVSPRQDYLVSGQMSFGEGDAYEFFLTPRLGSGVNPRVSVDGGMVTDLGDTFVMDPGYLAVDILLAGPPLGPQGSCLEDLIRDADFDSDGNGIPNNVFLSHSRLEATGLNARPSGATFSAVSGAARIGFDGGFNPLTESFEGSSEMVLGGLGQEPSMWRANRLRSRLLDTDMPAVPESYQNSSMGLTNRLIPDFEIVPGQTLPVDHHYCLSEVRVTFSTTSGTFFNPRLSGSGNFVGIDFEGNAADYGVGVSANGTPLSFATADDEGLVVMCPFAGTYLTTPFVTSVDPGGGTSNSELPPITFSCGCRQICVLTPEIQINLDPVAQCSVDATLPISGSVNSDVDVNRIFYTVGGGPEVDICSACGIDPTFMATADLSACANEVTVTAVDVEGNEASVTSTVAFDDQPPVLSGCEAIEVEVDPDVTETEVTFDVTAADNCPGPVSVECDPPSGSVFPVGETLVTCTAADACGGIGTCSFPVTVSSCEPVEPDVRTQGFWKRQCQGPHPSGEHGNLPGYVECVSETATFSSSSGVGDLCDALEPQPRNDKCEQAEAQLMAALLNVCSDRVRPCNCMEDPDLGMTTVEDAIDLVDALLADPARTFEDCELAQAVADRINNDATLVTCPE